MFITIADLPETQIATLSIGEFIADWNQRMASAIAEAKANGDEEADGYLYPLYWADPEFCGWGSQFPSALEWLIAMEYDSFSDCYKEQRGIRPRWVARPSTLAEMREICERYLS